MAALYNVEKFDDSKARRGALCMVANKELFYEADVWKGGASASGVDVSDNQIKGVGLCVYNERYYAITIDSVSYRFNSSGNGCDKNSEGLCAVIATLDELQLNTNPFTRAGDNNFAELTSLRPIDRFATEILGVLLENNKDRLMQMSKNEELFYCQKAYEWAEQMNYVATSYNSPEQEPTETA